MTRETVRQESLEKAAAHLIEQLQRRINQHGYGAFSSRHEVLGVLTEEYLELVEAVRQNKLQDFEDELADLAVGALFALACAQGGTLR